MVVLLQIIKHNILQMKKIITPSTFGILVHYILFSQIPEVFILVTDIDVSEQGVENFHFNMMALATTSSVWESKCNTELNSQLEQQITTIPKYYVTCRQLENKLNVISRA